MPKPSRTPPIRTVGVERAIWIALAVALALALTQLYIHAQLTATHGTYTSFCNVSATVNCDAVLMSPYAALLGIPIAAWGLLSYLALALLMVRRGRAVGAARSQTSLALVALAIWNVGISVYMATLSLAVLRHLCLLCFGTYLVVAASGVLTWSLARIDLGASGQPVLTSRRALVGGGAIVAGVAVIAALQHAALPISGATMTADEVRSRDPDFYAWYTTRPVTKDLPADAHSKGPSDAIVTIVEFSDFECPACGMAFRDLRDLVARHPDLVRLVFHHFPLDSECNSNVSTRMHRSACGAAIAAECAARAGKFWEYHDLLFGGQDKLGRDDLIAKAVGLGIPEDAFVSCLDDPDARARVLSDVAAGAKLGVKSTPTLVINGRTVEGALERSRYEYVIALERGT